MLELKNTPPYYKQGNPNVQVFKARISQAALNAPVALIFENTTDKIIVWEYLGVGYYRGTAQNMFPVLHTWISISQYGDSTGTLTQVYITDENTIELVNLTNGANADGMIINIEITIHKNNFII